MATAPIKQPMLITQRFGTNPGIYAQFGLKGHNGLDIVNAAGQTRGTPFFAMLPGVWHLLSDKDRWGRWKGYGAAWRLHFDTGTGVIEEWTFAHLQNRQKRLNGHNLPEGVQMAQLGNTGFVLPKPTLLKPNNGAHLHIGLRHLKNGQVLSYGNGYKGSIDPFPRLKEMGIDFVNG